MPAPLDDPLISTYGRLLEAHSKLVQRLGPAMAADSDLPLPWFEVLLRLARSPDGQMTMGALADEIALTTGGVTRLVDRMGKAGYVERHPNPNDRRVFYAGITDSGRAILDRAAAAHARNLHEVFSEFTNEELTTLNTLLDRLRS